MSQLQERRRKSKSLSRVCSIKPDLLTVAPNEFKALELIHSLNLYNHIFTFSPRMPTLDPASSRRRTFSIEGVSQPQRDTREFIESVRFADRILHHHINR